MGYSSVSFDPTLIAQNSDAASSALTEANVASAAAVAAQSKASDASSAAATKLPVDANNDVVVRAIQLSTGTRPSAASTIRGKIWYVAGAAGVKDTLEVCCKGADNVYSWRIIY